ncbi:hypothetical protein [Endomicrobium proavitum]|uniref:CBM-cenC domain-containing protein n=1 Tax=Endomicrobium proavitum TaxID=1408281 RepID=A0A0G3WH95_9BACT|nr:hypothetical protein [Endomicrobium proavitum]AKL97996.1 exported protein of unknown function [Endomicrobium proavitum]
MKKLLLLALPLIMFFTAGCENNPAGALIYNGVNDTDPASWASPFVIYANGDIMTRVLPFSKSVGAYTNIWEAYANATNVLEAQYDGESHTRHKSIKMGWDGSPSQVFDNGNTVYLATFWLPTSAGTSGKDLTPGAYTKISFWVKANLYTNAQVSIKVLNNDNSGNSPYAVTSITALQDWTYYEIPLSPSPALTYTYITVQMSPIAGNVTNGGTIYIDDIRLVR